MKPKDIVVGQKYNNTRHPDAEYIGVSTGVRKIIVRIAGEVTSGMGHRVVSSRLNPDFWAAFVPVVNND